MQAIKNRVGIGLISVAMLTLALTGCTPPGPRALLDGKEFLDEGRFEQAVEKLTLATSLMATNAQAWNYLGLACHRTGDVKRAAQAYQQALRLDRELFEAHYNLGCLWLDQNQAEPAKTEFMACTLRRGNSVEAWLKLGAAHSRLTEFTAAAESFQKALRLKPNNPEALNGLGLVSAQRRRSREAEQYFTAALKQDARYRPALLNLATVLRLDPNRQSEAAQRYREYLAMKPHAADWDAVNAVLQSIEPKPTLAPHAPAVSHSPAPVAVNTNITTLRATSSAALASIKIKSNLPPPVAKPAPAPIADASPVEVVRVPPEPVIHSGVAESKPTPPPSLAETDRNNVASEPIVAGSAERQEKRGFFSHLNPFHWGSKKASKSSATNVAVENSVLLETTDGSAPQKFPRYTYLSPPVPPAGDRKKADAAFARAVQAQSANKLSDAARAFRQATQADGSYFEAYYNLGLVLYSLRDYSRALPTWETALAIRPDAADARYNFALTLKAAGYVRDAAAQLEAVVAANPDDTRAHLALGNLYAEQLRDRVKARVHYQRVLELDSQHPSATQIRYWLVANPA